MAAVLPAWLEARALAVLGERSDGTGHVRSAVVSAARRAAEEAVAGLRALAATDVDEQRTTPLAVVRQCAGGELTATLVRSGVPAPAVAAGTGPAADPLGLAPTSWEQVDAGVHELALRWGVAKVRAHRARHAASHRAEIRAPGPDVRRPELPPS